MLNIVTLHNDKAYPLTPAVQDPQLFSQGILWYKILKIKILKCI